MSDFFKDFVSKGIDPGKVIAEELDQALTPVTSRVDEMGRKIDEMNKALHRIEILLLSIQPLVKLLNKLPFVK